ncbi:MAG TPA: 3'-5' exonuclease, partial [Bacteroidales bacterium]|nr:3'-5' exonuclease [Bacteroidales bacterium]
AFRGANIANILNFRKDYPEVKVFKLEQNYRSTQTIVNAANGVIAQNKDQIQKVVWTENNSGDKISLFRAATDSEEGRLVAGNIFETKMNDHCANHDFAILYRTNAQSRSLEEALRKQNLPYKIYGGLSFYQRKEIKDLLAYFRLTINHEDEEALLRIINYPTRGIGATSQQKLTIKAQENDVPLWDVIDKAGTYGVEISAAVNNRLHQFKTMIESFRAQLSKKNAYELAKHIASTTGIIKTLNDDKTPEGISRFENLEELLNAINEFSEKNPDNEDEEESPKTLDVFMQDVALLTDQDNDDKNESDRVSLMTIHAAKGLEFPYVYIVGLEENLFPSMQSLNTRADLEEERRLFYVALTRAENKSTISYAETRYKWGNLIMSEPSRFIEEIEPEYLDVPASHYHRENIKPAQTKQRNPFKDQPSYKKMSAEQSANMKKASDAKPKSPGAFPACNPIDIHTGIDVEHQKFGVGKVLNIEGQGANKKATIFFRRVGQKNLLLKFARLKILKS